MKSHSLQRQFSDVTAKLEDMHAIAVEAQSDDNSPDIQQELCVHHRSGLAALNGALKEMAVSLDAGQS